MRPLPQPVIVDECEGCSREILENEEYVIYDGYPFCDEYCFAEYAVKKGIVVKRIAGEEL